MQQRIAFHGEPASGKTSVVNRLIKEPFNSSHTSTINLRVNWVTDPVTNNKFIISDLPGLRAYDNYVDGWSKEINIHIICIDLSKTFNPCHTLNKIEQLKQITPHATIILMGTKIDTLSEDKKKTAINQLTTWCEGKYIYFAVSAKDNIGLDDFFSFINNPVVEFETEIETDDSGDNNDSLEELKYRIAALDDYYEEDDNFKKALKHLLKTLEQNPLKNSDAAQQTINATNTLLNDFYSNHDNTIDIFQTYLNNCPHTSLLSKLIKTVVVTGVIALVGTALATGICFSLGLGVGIGIGIAASAGAVGLLTSGMLFFKKNPIEKAIEPVVKTGEILYRVNLENNLNENDSSDDVNFQEPSVRW